MVALLVGSQALASPPDATVTLVEGGASIIRGTERYALVEGVGLAAGDIVEVAGDGLLEVEFPDGTRLGLGPDTQLLTRLLSQGATAAEFQIVSATLKHESADVPAGRYIYDAPHLILQPAVAAVTAVLTEEESAAFLESGEARVTEPVSKGEPASVDLGAGDFYRREGDQPSTVVSRPSPEFISSLPPGFLDPLPSRMSRYQDQDVTPELVGQVTYEEVAYWLEAPKALRRPFLDRFVKRVSDPAFRAALVRSMSKHPEWDPILFPEKYEPKEKPKSPTEGTASPSGEGTTSKETDKIPSERNPKEETEK